MREGESQRLAQELVKLPMPLAWRRPRRFADCPRLRTAGDCIDSVQYVYQLGSYWHKQDPLSRDLYDLTLGFFAGALLGIGLRIVS